MSSHKSYNLLRTVGMILVILILLIIFWPADSTQIENDSSPPKNSLSKSKATTENTPADKSGSTRVVRVRSKSKPQDEEFDPYLDWPLSKILSHFMVPPGEFRAGSINASIAKLQAIYQQYSGHQLEISLEASDHSDTVVSFEHDNISFRTLLGMVAGLSGYSVEVTPGEVVFNDITPPLPRTEIERNSPHALSKEAFAEILEHPEKTREYLTSLGFHTPEVFGFPDDPKELANLINSLQDARLDPQNTPRQVVVRNKLLSFPPGFEFEATALSDSEVQQLMRDWSQTKGVDIITSPSITALPGQDATIEIGQQVLLPPGENEEDIRTEFVGLHMVFNPVLAGLDQIQIEGEVSVSSTDGTPVETLTNDSIRKSISESETHLNDGHSVLLPFTDEKGNTAIQVITSQRLDASGEPFWPPRE